jgi:hypothetical protein
MTSAPVGTEVIFAAPYRVVEAQALSERLKVRAINSLFIIRDR